MTEYEKGYQKGYEDAEHVFNVKLNAVSFAHHMALVKLQEEFSKIEKNGGVIDDNLTISKEVEK